MLLPAALHYPGRHPDLVTREDSLLRLLIRLVADFHRERFGDTPDNEAAHKIEPITNSYLLDTLAVWQSDSERRARVAEELRQAIGV